MSKFHAIKVIDPVDGKFDSKAEYARWVELKLLAKKGEIKDLQRQVPFALYARSYILGDDKKCEVGKYVADFTYINSDGLVVEDVKGVITPMFRWKAKHFAIQYGFPITVVGNVKKSGGKRKRKAGNA